ncbi:MAG TPA: response regulator transcription factor [Orrella sp.]
MDTQLTIAVVEDHDDLREAMVEALVNQGHQVVALCDAEQFAVAAAGHSFDLVIVDLNLPGEDGMSLTKRLRQQDPKLGLVIVSARGLVQEKTQGYESGADIYLTKPVALQELVAAVQSLGQRIRAPEAKANVRANLNFAQLELTGTDGTTVVLSWHEAVLLRALIVSKERQLDSWQLMEAMGKNTQAYSKSALELVVLRLRKRMQSVGFEANVITAVRNKGYMLLGEVDVT